MAQRPTGVSVLAVLMIIGGVLGIIGSLTAVALLSTLAGTAGLLLAFVVIVPLIIAVVQVVVGVGLWKLLSWAWMAAIVITVIGAIFTIISLISGGSVASNIISLAIDALIVWYLFRPEVKSVFR